MCNGSPINCGYCQAVAAQTIAANAEVSNKISKLEWENKCLFERVEVLEGKQKVKKKVYKWRCMYTNCSAGPGIYNSPEAAIEMGEWREDFLGVTRVEVEE